MHLQAEGDSFPDVLAKNVCAYGHRSPVAPGIELVDDGLEAYNGEQPTGEGHESSMQASARMTTVRSDCDHVHAPLLGLSRSLPFAFPSLGSATRTTDAILASSIGLVLQARSDVHLACTWLRSNGCGQSRGIAWCALIGVQVLPSQLAEPANGVGKWASRYQLAVSGAVSVQRGRSDQVVGRFTAWVCLQMIVLGAHVITE